MTVPETHGLFGVLKSAVEKFELNVLAKDAAVGPAQQALAPMVGRWVGTMQTWLSPGEPYDVQHVTSTMQWTLGDRFLEQRFEGLFLGRPFSALCITGYDDAARRYEASWMDSATTAMLSLAGQMDSSSKVLTLFGSMKLTAIPGTTVDIRSAIAMEDANALRYEISIGRFGLWVKAHQIDLTRSA